MKTIIKRSALVLALLAGTVEAQTANEDMLKLVNSAITLHSTVQAEVAQAQAAHENLDAANKRRWPNLFAQGSSQTGGQGTIGAEVTLFDFGKTTAGIAQAQAQLGAQQHRIEEAQYNIAQRVIEAWHLVLVATEKRQVLETAKSRLDQLQQMMQRRVDSQVSPAIELELVAARLRQLQAEDSNQQTIIQQNLARLNFWTGMQSRADGATLERHVTQRSFLLKDQLQLEKLLAPSGLLKDHPSIRSAQQQVNASIAEAQVANASAYPQLYARLEKATGDALKRERVAVFGLRWESGAGLNNLAQARAQAARARAQEYNLASVQEEVNQQLITQREALRNALSKSQRMQEAKLSSQQILDSYDRLFVAGRKSWLEVMNAWRENYEMQLAVADGLNEASNLIWQMNAKTGAIKNGTWVSN